MAVFYCLIIEVGKFDKELLLRKWDNKLLDAKEAFLFANEQTGKTALKFEDTKTYKDLIAKKKRALAYYKNRKKLNKKRRVKYKLKKKVAKKRENYSYLDDITVYEAFSGPARVFESELRRLYKDKKFVGEIRYKKREYLFTDKNKYSIKVNAILAYLYHREDEETQDNSYFMFFWRVRRWFFYEKKTDTFFSRHEFYLNENEVELFEPEEEEEF